MIKPDFIPNLKYYNIFPLIVIAICYAFTSSNQGNQPSYSKCKIPDGYKIFSKHSYDLNGDNLKDSIFIIKGTQMNRMVENRFGNKVDRNKRGILIFFKTNDGYNLITQNLDCFSSENEDGGVYFPPELSIEPTGGNIKFHYSHGRYGYWYYSFSYINSDFELLTYYSAQSTSGSTAYYQTVEIDLKNQKKYVNVNVNESDLDGKEIYETTIENCPIKESYKLSEIEDFYNIRLCE